MLRVSLLTVLLALACLLPSLADPPPFSAASEKVGPLKLGMPGAQVQAAFGKPQSQGAWIDEAATGLQVQEWKYPARGVFVTVSRENASATPRVERFRVTRPSGHATSKGVKVGDTAAKVKAAYGKLVSAEESSGSALVVGSIYDGVIFTLKGGKVTEIFVGAAAE